MKKTMILLSAVILAFFVGCNNPAGESTTYYTLSFDGNNAASGDVPEAVKQAAGSIVELPGNTGSLALSGYYFAGWNTEADGSGTSYSEGAEFTFTADATLYAQWSETLYTLTYDKNGAESGTVPSSVQRAENGTVTLPDNTGSLALSGYEFGGWNTTAEGDGTSYSAGSTYTFSASNVTLYAEWEIEYTLTYDGNGADSGDVPSSVTGIEGDTITLPDNTGSLVLTGYAFSGWNTAQDGNGTSYDAGASYTLTAQDVTLYAQWDDVTPPETITLTGFEAGNDGFSLTWDDPADEDLATIVCEVKGEDGSSVSTASVTAGTESLNLASKEASTFYTLSLTCVDSSDNVSEEIILAVRTTASDTLTYELVWTADDLADIADDRTGAYLIMNDIDLTDVEWTPIGSSSSTAFKGTVLGNRCVISNLTIDSNGDYKGLFGYVGGAELYDLGVTDGNVAGATAVGLLVGDAYDGAVISHCYAEGDVSGTINVGGLCGYLANSSTISCCYVDVTVTSSLTEGKNIGGLVGCCYNSKVSNSYALGSVTGYYAIGGLIGYYDNYSLTASLISKCYSAASINYSDDDGKLMGGLVGRVYTVYGTSITASNKNKYDSFYDSQTSGFDTAGGEESDWTQLSTPKTTEEMNTKATYLEDDDNDIFDPWDFDDIWSIDSSTNDGYPYLTALADSY